MAKLYQVIDKSTGQVHKNSKGVLLTDLTEADKESFKKRHKELGDLDNFTLQSRDVEEEKVEPSKERFQNHGKLASLFPAITEQMDNGNSEFNYEGGEQARNNNLDLAVAGVKDVASLPFRAGHTIYKSIKDENYDLNDMYQRLGRQSSETEGAESMVRDPINGLLMGSGRLIGQGVKLGVNAGEKALSYLAGKVVPKVVKDAKKAERVVKGAEATGKMLGGATAGGAEGVGVESLDASLNDRKPEYTVPAIFSATTEGVGQVIAMLGRKFGMDLVRDAVSALKLGNTNEARRISEDEIVEFCKDPSNVDALVKFLNQQSSGRNLLPWKGIDRRKTLAPILEEAEKNATSTLRNDPQLQILNRAEEGESLVKADNKRKYLAVNDQEGKELYRNKTITREQKYKPDVENVPEAEESLVGKDRPWRTNDEFHFDQFADKYTKIDNKIKNARTNPKAIMSQEEKDLLDLVRNDLINDNKELARYNKDHAVKNDTFFMNRNPFADESTFKAVESYLSKHNVDGVSAEFKNELMSMVGGGITNSKQMLGVLEESLNKVRPTIERSLAYAKKDPYLVKKGYSDAVDHFADQLDSYIENSIGTKRTNGKGEEYIVTKDKMSKYGYNYLYKVQDMLQAQQALDADFITALYGQATNANDTRVQEMIIDLLKNIGVDKNSINEFKKVGATYAMLNKAYNRVGKAGNEKGVFDGTVLSLIEPKKGFNAKNAIGYRFQKDNFNLGNISQNPNNPTKAGTFARTGLYLLGRPYTKDALKGD